MRITGSMTPVKSLLTSAKPHRAPGSSFLWSVSGAELGMAGDQDSDKQWVSVAPLSRRHGVTFAAPLGQ